MKRIIAAFAIAMMVCGSAAWADQPIENPVATQVIGAAFTDCGDFSVLTDYRIEGYRRLYFNSDGSLDRAFLNVEFLDGVVYNADDPSYWLAKEDGQVLRWVHYKDGMPTAIVSNGPQNRIIVPGYGIVYQGIGHLVLDLLTGEVTLAGQHDFWFGPSDTFCALLRP